MRTGVTFKSDSALYCVDSKKGLTGSEIIESDVVSVTEGRLNFIDVEVDGYGAKRGTVKRSIALDQIADYRNLEA